METFTESYPFITHSVINALLPPVITNPEKMAKSFITLFNGEGKREKNL